MDGTASHMAMIDLSYAEVATQATPSMAAVSEYATDVFRFFDLPRELRDQVGSLISLQLRETDLRLKFRYAL